MVRFSRQGVMFFANPVAAFQNLRRATRTCGRLAFASWRPLPTNPWLSVPLDAARPLLPCEPEPTPNAPGSFALADPAYTGCILHSAGWRDVHAARKDVTMHLAGSGETEIATDFSIQMGALTRLLAGAEPRLRAEDRRAVVSALAAHDSPRGIELGGSVWIVTARA